MLSIKEVLCAGFFSPFSPCSLPLRWPHRSGRRARRRKSAPISLTPSSTTTSASGAIKRSFCNSFLKNHYPLLKKIQATGRILSVKIESPAYHTSEELRWDFRVTIRYKNSTVATTANPDEEAFIKELWPDQETYKRESSGGLRFCSDTLICR